jgi:hypothetical protein
VDRDKVREGGRDRSRMMNEILLIKLSGRFLPALTTSSTAAPVFVARKLRRESVHAAEHPRGRFPPREHLPPFRHDGGDSPRSF